MVAKQRKRRETFGALRKLPSGRYQASYIGPDGHRHPAPRTFDTQTDARAWLGRMRISIADNKWAPVAVASSTTFGDYAREWIATRTTSRGERLRPSTLNEYDRLLNGPLGLFAGDRLAAITSERVRRWNADELAKGTLTQSARAYALLKAVLNTAVEDGRIAVNPCGVRGAVKASTGKKVSPPSPEELAKIIGAIAPRFRLLVEISAWGSLRWGEVTELRRGDVLMVDEDIALNITRAVTYTGTSGFVVGKPKSFAGIRLVSLPPFLLESVRDHLATLASAPDALLFPSANDPAIHLSAGSFAPYWQSARKAAKREDMPFHALRHFGATAFAQAGATLREIQDRLGHSTVTAAMRYQHTAGRESELARRMQAGSDVSVT